MHDLVLRSSLLYVYCMIYETREWEKGDMAVYMVRPVRLERGLLDEGRALWL